MNDILGSRIIAVSDSKGGIYNEQGLDPHKVLNHKRRTGSVVDFPEAENIRHDELFSLEVEILCPAALENAIMEENVSTVRAKLIAELANGPVTPEAEDILSQNGVFVIPDFLCNAGGVVVSYFEWVQCTYKYYWDKEQVYFRLNRKMTEAFKHVLCEALERKVTMRTAAYIVAVSRVAEAMKLRGLA